MIKITIDSKEVDLPSDFCFEYTEENMLMEEDTLPVPFTTSIEFPLKKSIRNQSIFGHKHRVTSTTSDLTYKCIVYVDGFVLVDGWYIVESMGDVVSGELKMVNPTNDLDKPIDKFDWPKIYVGDTGNSIGEITGVHGNATSYHYQRWNKMLKQLNDYILSKEALFKSPYIRLKRVSTALNSPPKLSADQSHFSMERTMFFGATIKKGVDDSGTIINDYIISFGGATDGPNGLYHQMFPVLPALDFGVIFNTLIGNNVAENPISSLINDEDMRLYCQTVTSPNFIEGSTNYPYFEAGEQISEKLFKKFFSISLFMPAIPAYDFIKAALNLFCCSIYFDKGSIFIKKNKDILTGRNYIDISKYAVSYQSVNIDRCKEYVCGYSDLEAPHLETESEDVSLVQDIIKSNRDGSDGLFKDRFGNIWECKKVDEYTDGWSYTPVDTRLHKAPIEDKTNVFDKTTKLIPVLYSIFNQWEGRNAPTFPWPHKGTGRPDVLNYYPMRASYIDKMGTKDDMFKIGFLNDYDNVFSYDNIGIDDLIRKYHREYKDWIEKDKKLVTVDMLITASELFKMKLWNKVYFQGRMFLIKKRTMRFYMDFIDLTTLELVECQCPLITEEPT